MSDPHSGGAFSGYKGIVESSVARAAFQADLTQMFAFTHSANIRAGWWSAKDGSPKQRNVGEILMLAVSELAEAMEGDRKELFDDKLPQFPMFIVEIQDAIIRLFDIAGSLNGCFQGNMHSAAQSARAFCDKVEFNFHRADHKLEHRNAPGGKAY